MINRRKFLKLSTLLSAGIGSGFYPLKGNSKIFETGKIAPSLNSPVVISTWNHGIDANVAAWHILSNNGRAVDAVEAGVRVTEADPDNLSVGYGGLPDRDGNVTLDACIMDEFNNAGSVCFLQHIKHPISVARLVMDQTPHVMLAGDGALKFALDNGFYKENLLTEKSKEAWKKWKEESQYAPAINVENHDTIGMLALDNEGRLSGACTTSGAAFKYYGRVGDSPIIGAGLFVDNEVGGAVATGLGEMVMKTLGSFLVVELMRNGLSPQEACEEAVDRIIKKVPDYKKHQVGYLAINRSGEHGAYAIHKGFNYALMNSVGNRLIDSACFLQ